MHCERKVWVLEYEKGIREQFLPGKLPHSTINELYDERKFIHPSVCLFVVCLYTSRERVKTKRKRFHTMPIHKSFLVVNKVQVGARCLINTMTEQMQSKYPRWETPNYNREEPLEVAEPIRRRAWCWPANKTQLAVKSEVVESAWEASSSPQTAA